MNSYLLMTIAMLATVPPVKAMSPIPDAEAVHAIVGEAENQGYVGMLAIAYAIRNRGSLHGVRGAQRDISNAPTYVVEYAMQAWKASKAGADITHGATHWENVRAFGLPDWAQHMTRTVIIKDHWFYKESIKP